MRNIFVAAAALCAICLMWQVCPADPPVPGNDAPVTVVTVKPNYLPPAELLTYIGLEEGGGAGPMQWSPGPGLAPVEIRRNDAANMLVLTGPAPSVEAAQALIRQADVPPRQIAVEAKIVEIDQAKARHEGIDWDLLLKSGSMRASANYDEINGDHPYDDRTQRRVTAGVSFDLSRALNVLDQSGAATIRNAPRILTLNNRRATILDGQRVTYVTRYSSYTNLFVTDSMDAGLTLSVLPSLGESGYLTLQVRAELTSLLGGDISGSPIKDGQIVENTVIAKDGETVLLGGFQRTVERKTKWRFPGLGYVLPFLFSHESAERVVVQTFIALTPRVVDLAVAVDPATDSLLQGDK